MQFTDLSREISLERSDDGWWILESETKFATVCNSRHKDNAFL